MTAVGPPAPSTPPAPAVGAALALPGDRGSGGQSGDQQGSAFGSVLGALDEPAPQTAAASTPTGAAASAASGPGVWRTISAVHALGSGVLFALDKRLEVPGGRLELRIARL